MKVVILCGGKGTRMREVSDDTPKPLALVGNKPILWHIMNHYSQFGYKDFILLLGYKGEKIKEYFVNCSDKEQWHITFLDTGLETMTGGRIARAAKFIEDETFMMTYGDGLADVDIKNLVEHHKSSGKIATLTAVKRKSQFGILRIQDGIVTEFTEKPVTDELINGGYFVLNKEVFGYLRGEDNCIFEKDPMKKLAEEGQLAAYLHEGFWQAIDTYKDLLEINDRYYSGMLNFLGEKEEDLT